MIGTMYNKIELIRSDLNKFSHSVSDFRALLTKNNIDLKITVTSASFWQCQYDFVGDTISGEVTLNIQAVFISKDDANDKLETTFNFRVNSQGQSLAQDVQEEIINHVIDHIKEGKIRGAQKL